MALLVVNDLQVRYRTPRGESRAVDGVSFSVGDDEYVGVVGESGCGKSTLAKAILRILPENGRIAGGEILFKGRDLAAMPEAELRRLRWREISTIPQSAMNCLDPVRRVGDQIVEAIRTHERVPQEEAWERAAVLLALVGMERKRLKDFPHQFSGGMRQRAMIAMALALNPALIIADEPTTGLDVIVQDQILQRINELRQELHKGMLLITHDIAVVAENCHRVVVMYAGKVMEMGPVAAVIGKSCNPYTIGLRQAFPNIKSSEGELVAIAGAPPDLVAPPPGCLFAPRCPFVLDVCTREEPMLRPVGDGHVAACHRLDEAEALRQRAATGGLWQRAGAVAE